MSNHSATRDWAVVGVDSGFVIGMYASKGAASRAANRRNRDIAQGRYINWVGHSAEPARVEYRPNEPFCADCGMVGELTGHMGCQFPQNH